MSQIVKDMRNIYRIKHYDFMGYTFRNIHEVTYHHLDKKCDGGPKTLDNGALLVGDTAHPYLHIIEDREFDMYVYINRILKSINSQHSQPTMSQLKAIRAVLLEFEREHCHDRNTKGDYLIKRKFLERRIDFDDYSRRR